MESEMSRLGAECFDQFLDSLKQAGIVISNETELRERLAEAQRWRFAFATLARCGRSLGIRFEESGVRVSKAAIHRAFSRFDLPESLEISFAAGLLAQH